MARPIIPVATTSSGHANLPLAHFLMGGRLVLVDVFCFFLFSRRDAYEPEIQCYLTANLTSPTDLSTSGASWQCGHVLVTVTL
ncbi:MAG: hypothetical protein IIA59_06930 [Candidatus Marinimicrobia bacterium]|nr:hypothetical protein [Candidatus Neomarinimicrobiota bacterium]